MSLTDKLASERRARLAAERMLELKSRELFEANRKLSQHALSLSGQIIEQREEVRTVRDEAAALKDRNQKTQADLERAEKRVEIVERRLWDSVEAITDGFAVFDGQDRLIAANSAWLSLFDYSDVIQPGISYIDVLRFGAEEGVIDTGDGPIGSWIADMLDRWDQPEIPAATITLWNRRHYRLLDRRTHDGDMVCLAQDITTMKAREEELAEARLRAEAASRAKSTFLANMSHELRTPMNGVVAMAEMLLEGALDEEQRLYIQTIRNSGETLLGIINDVLDFSKMEAEKLTLRPAPFDLELMLHEVLTLVAPMAREKGLELHVDYDLFLPTKLVGDAGRIRQVLTNLVGNAVKFTLEGYILLRVVGIETAPALWQMHVTVEDTGIGIETGMQQHIFESFAQVEQDRNRAFEGTGLGLAISRQLIGLMAGQIWVESEKGSGSCFGFQVPLPAAEGHPPIPASLAAGGLRAMMVGGGDLDQDILSKQLRQLGIVVRCVGSGSEALDAVRVEPMPQIVLIDERLPDTEGLELATALRQAGLHTATVLLCTDAHRAASPAARAVVDATLTRPIRRSELFRTLDALSPVRAPAPPGVRTEVPAPDPGGDRQRFRQAGGAAAEAAAPPRAAADASGAPVAPAPGPAAPTVPPADARPDEIARSGPRPGPAADPASAPDPEPAPAVLRFASRRSHPAPPGGTVPADRPDNTPAASAVVPPTLPAGASALQVAARSTPAAAPRLPPGRPMRVLAAEDNRTNQLVLRQMVKSLDIELTVANNGREAVDLFQSVHPDLIFMDISMPEMDGKEATRAIRALEPAGARVPIVALTAHALAGDREEILSAGLDHYLTKPLKRDPLEALILGNCPADCRPPLPEPALGR